MSGRRAYAERNDAIQAARATAHVPLVGTITAKSSSKRPDAASILTNALSEREFQSHVLAALRSRGWITFVVPNMRMTTAGLPDVLAIHRDRPVLLAWELKGPKTRVQPIQRAVNAVMQGIPGVDARIIRPSDWAGVLEELDQ